MKAAALATFAGSFHQWLIPDGCGMTAALAPRRSNHSKYARRSPNASATRLPASSTTPAGLNFPAALRALAIGKASPLP